MRAKEFITKNPMPREVEQHLQYLTPDDVGVDEVGDYRIHFEGFTDFCKSSSDYCANPEAVYQEVFSDFIAREGGQKPLWSGMVGSEEYPILYSVFKNTELTESVSAEQVVNYVNSIHPAEEKTDALDRLILSKGNYILTSVPVSILQIEAEEDPYNRVIDVNTHYARRITRQELERKPIVIDRQGHILDGNHRAWQAKELGIVYIPAYVPEETLDESLDYQGNCTEDDVIEYIFGDATTFAQLVDEYGDEFELDDLVVKYDPETDVHSFYYKNTP